MEPLEEYKKPHRESFAELPDLKPELPKAYAAVYCPKCTKPVSADDLNIQDKIAKCGSCHVVFPFTELIESFDQTPKKVKQEIFRPEGIDLFYFKDELEIGIRQPDTWIDWILYLLLPLIVTLGPIIAYKHGLSTVQILMVVVPIIFSVFYFIRRKKHRVFINIDHHRLSIRWRPRKFHRDQSYAIRDIDQIYIKQLPGMGIFNIMMIVDEGAGQKHVVLTSTQSTSKAKYLEQEIERYLGIPDIEVPEEMKI